MPSQFFGLNIAYTGLLNSNASLNTASNNIANVQTEGYSRQQVNSQAANALRVFQTYGCAGAGVETLSIERIRDEFYDFRYWANNAKVGEHGQKQYYMQQIEAYFDDNGQNAGFKTVFDRFMITGLQELMKNPANLSFKEQFISYGKTLTEYFNGVAGNLQKVQKDANEEIKVKVDEINSIASEIATLNKQINVIEMTGKMKANELRDRRTLLLDQLSEIVDVETKETKIKDKNNPDRETGGTRFIVKIAGGQLLVDGGEYNGLECVARTDREKVNQSDVDGLYDVYWTGKDHSKFNLYNAAMGGALRGLVDLRDGNNSENFSGTITDLVTDAGKESVTVKVDKHYLTDLNKCNLSDTGGVINLGSKLYYYDSWTYSVKYDENGEAEYSYTFQLSQGVDADGKPLNQPLTADRKNMPATAGTAISYQGVPYYMSQMNEWLRTFSQKFNDILVSGYSGDTPGIDLFAANKTTEDGQYVFDEAYRYDRTYQQLLDAEVKKLTKEAEDAGKDITDQTVLDGILADAKKNVADRVIEVTVGRGVTDKDNYYLMNAMNFDVSTTLQNDPDRLANKKNLEDGVDQNDLLEEIKLLATNKDKMSFRGCTSSEFLQCILGDVALNTERAETFYQSYCDIAYTIDTQRISISGVDEDEEAVNLVRFQNGYNLASKMIQVLTEVYDKLILETGV